MGSVGVDVYVQFCGFYRLYVPTSAEGRPDLVLCPDRANLSDVLRLADAAGDAGKVRLLRSYDSEATPGDDEVPDPWGGDDVEFDLVLALIERSCRGLVAELANAPR